jgi:hypothetical protein
MRRMTRIWLAVVLAGTVACTSDGAGAPTDAPTSPSSTPTVIATPDVSGPCANDYLPVVRGVTSVFQRTIGQKVARFRQTVEDVTDQGFVVLLRLSATGERDVWTCSPAGLINLEQYETGPNGGKPPPGTVRFRHFRSEGVTVPTDVANGSSWTQVVTSRTVFTVDGVDYPEKRVVTTSYRAVAEESVTTPLGTFDALKIETTMTTRKMAPTFGNGIDQRSTSVFTQWWARGVGLVQLMEAAIRGHHDPARGIPRPVGHAEAADESRAQRALFTEGDPGNWGALALLGDSDLGLRVGVASTIAPQGVEGHPNEETSPGVHVMSCWTQPG